MTEYLLNGAVVTAYGILLYLFSWPVRLGICTFNFSFLSGALCIAGMHPCNTLV